MENIDSYYLYSALSNFMAKELWALVHRTERALEINTHKKGKKQIIVLTDRGAYFVLWLSRKLRLVLNGWGVRNDLLNLWSEKNRRIITYGPAG